jgi:hypothetical protein
MRKETYDTIRNVIGDVGDDLHDGSLTLLHCKNQIFGFLPQSGDIVLQNLHVEKWSDQLALVVPPVTYKICFTRNYSEFTFTTSFVVQNTSAEPVDEKASLFVGTLAR